MHRWPFFTHNSLHLWRITEKERILQDETKLTVKVMILVTMKIRILIRMTMTVKIMIVPVVKGILNHGLITCL